MRGIYQILFKLQIKHEYYVNGLYKNVLIQPTQQTQRELTRHKLLFRATDGQLNVLGLVDNEGDPVYELEDGLKFTFMLKVTDPSFFNITQLEPKDSFKEVYYLNNLGLAGDTELTTNDWVLAGSKILTFNYALESEADEVVLSIDDVHDQNVLEKPLHKQEDNFNLAVDFDTNREGKYTFKLSIDGSDQNPQHVFLCNELQRSKPTAVLEFFSSELSFDDPKSYTLKFEAREEQWKYMVMLKKDYSGSTISIKDTRETPLVAFKNEVNDYAKGSTLTFESVEVDNDSNAMELKYSEEPIKDFSLIIEKNGVQNEVKGLPNPSTHQVKPEMYINI